jgi:hypothetical protein
VNELERQLIEVGRELEFPPSPDVAARVARVLPERPPARALRRRRALRVAVVTAALLLLIAGTVLAAVPSARNGILDLLGLRGATVERAPTIPPASRRANPKLALGKRTTLAGARRALPFDLLVPRRLGGPDGVYVRSEAGGYVSLAYRPRPGLPEARETGLGLLVSEFRGAADPDYLGKIASFGTRVRRFRLDGDPAVWLAGAPHDFFYRRPNGRVRESTLRLAANVLLVQGRGLLIRLEGTLRRSQTIAIARSLRTM